MRVKVWGLAGVGLVCGVAVLAGCGAGTVAGEASPEGVEAGEPVFSPCDDIPDDVLREMGLDPESESRDVLGVKQPGWNVCGWDGSGYIQSVFATIYTMDDIHSNTRNTDFRPVEVGGREALMYREVSDRKRETCDVAFRSGEGAIMVRASLHSVTPTAEDPCQIALRAAHRFETVIPQ